MSDKWNIYHQLFREFNLFYDFLLIFIFIEFFSY